MDAKNPRDVFTYGFKVLDGVNSFKYLGIEFSRDGTFFKGKKMAYDQAQKSMFSLWQSAKNQDLPVYFVLELYQTTALPVFFTVSEIWGYENLIILEQFQIKFLNLILTT